MRRAISTLLVLCIFWHSIVSQEGQARPADLRTITLDLKSFHDGQLFYTPMTVGRGQYEKTFRMLVGTSNYMTWIISANVSSVYGYEDGSSVRDNSEKHIVYFSRYFGGYFNYYIHNDTWKVSPRIAPINNQQFAVIIPPSASDHGTIEGVDGMLGLHKGHSEPEDVHYLFENLHKLNYIDYMMYSLYINNTALANRLNNNDYDDSQAEGALLLGGIDARYYTGKLKYAKLLDEDSWDYYSEKSLYISNIQLDWSRVSLDKLDDSISLMGTFDIEMEPEPLKLDSSVILYSGDSKILDTIHLEIMKADKILGNSLYAFKDCRVDNKPDIVFTLLEGLNVTITPEEYVIESEIDDLKVCLSAFKVSMYDVWVFGTKFMRKYYTVFDYKNNRVGFATPT